ncbi:retinal pigment epithelial membrane protein-domain-containing protein [Coemansia mojavensis]|nr:retinal pigment epithelial membrane protein-domain-containing protein [Coemansia mojavensis]
MTAGITDSGAVQNGQKATMNTAKKANRREGSGRESSAEAVAQPEEKPDTSATENASSQSAVDNAPSKVSTEIKSASLHSTEEADPNTEQERPETLGGELVDDVSSIADEPMPAVSADVQSVVSPGETDRLIQSQLSPVTSRTSSKAPAASHPLESHEQAPPGPSPATMASAILMRDSDTVRASGSGAAGGSGESERTAFSTPMQASGSPLSSTSMRALYTGISEATDDEEDSEDRQRRLFRAAERRRLDKEQMQQNNMSSDELEILRSGLSNAREFVKPSELRILNGAFPDGLRGSLFLLGPGQIDIKYNVQRELEQATRVFTYGNIMDALPLLTKISFDPAAKTITHRSRLLAKQAAGRIQMEHGVNTKVPGALYLTNTNQSVLSKFIPKASHQAMPEGECCSQDIQLFMPLQGSSQNIVCTNHVGALQNIDPVDLRPRSTVEYKSVNRAFKGTLSCPHMQHDSNAREHFTVIQDVGFRSTTFSVICISEAQPEGYVVASFTAQASIVHSFAITQDYVVVPVYPYDSPLGGISYRWSDSLLETLSFDHSQPVLFYVISREYRRVQCVYRAPTFFALHQINAVQETATDSVAIDMVTYEDDAILRRLQTSNLRKPSSAFPVPAGVVRRFQLNGITMEASRYASTKGNISLAPPAHSRILLNEQVELCQINPMLAMYPYTFVYALGHSEILRKQLRPGIEGALYDCIVKLNVNDSSAPSLIWSRAHCYPSEPVFVPKNDQEDDGYILSVFFDSMRITSCLVVLDAATFKELLIAQLPTAIPVSFGHGKFAI